MTEKEVNVAKEKESLNPDDYQVELDTGVYQLVGSVFTVTRNGKTTVLMTNVGKQ